MIKGDPPLTTIPAHPPSTGRRPIHTRVLPISSRLEKVLDQNSPKLTFLSETNA
jgi:hypothetical protein